MVRVVGILVVIVIGFIAAADTSRIKMNNIFIKFIAKLIICYT